jgi:hypothetical protein
MEQSESLPRYMYLPKPLEQLFDSSQLGKLLEVCQRGWNRDKRPSKLVALLITLGGLAALVAATIVVIDAVESTDLIVDIIFLVPVVPALIALFGIILLFQTSLWVGAYSEGLVYAKATRVTVLYWSEIVAISRKKINPWYNRGPSRLPDLVKLQYTIQTHDGRMLQLQVPYWAAQKLDKIIQEHTA